jgi:hypothetical protein
MCFFKLYENFAKDTEFVATKQIKLQFSLQKGGDVCLFSTKILTFATSIILPLKTT